MNSEEHPKAEDKKQPDPLYDLIMNPELGKN